MEIIERIIELVTKGIDVQIDAKQLVVSSSDGFIDSQDELFLKENKAKILQLLEELKISSCTQLAYLSCSQNRLWFIDRMQSSSAQYNMIMALELNGGLNVDAIRQAFKKIIERHQVIRTTIHSTPEGEPFQVIRNHDGFSIPLIDLSSLSNEKQEERLKKIYQGEASKPFDLSKDLMLRVQILKRAKESHIMIVTMHHIASDGWSQIILVKELSALYDAYVNRKDIPLDDLEIQYADYAHWQRNWLKGECYEHHLNFWKKQLRDLPEVHSIPLDHSRLAEQDYRGSSFQKKLGTDILVGLNSLAHKHSATLFMVLNSALAVLLGRYSNEEDILIGSPVANRDQVELDPLVGFFVNTLVLRTDLSDNPTFEVLLERSKRYLLSAYEHQELPFEKLVDELQPERNLAHSPVFQIMLAMDNNKIEELELADIKVKNVELSNSVAKFDLTLNISERDGLLCLYWTYATALFNASTIERMANHFEVLLKNILAKPQARVSDLPIMSSAEEHQQLVEWNDTEANYPKDKCVQELFELQVARTPDAIAVVCGTQRTSYGELNHRANQLSHHLIEQGIKPGVRVGIYAEHSLEMLVGFLGILKAGGCYVLLEPEFPSLRLKYLIEDSDIELILFQSGLNRAQCLTEMYIDATSGEATRRLNWIDLDGDWVRKAGDSMRDNPVTSSSPLDLASVIYAPNDVSIPAGLSVNHESIVSLVSPGEGVGNSVSTNPENEKPTVQMPDSSTGLSCYEIWKTLVKGASLVFKQEKEPVELTAKTSIEAYAPINQRLSNMTRYVMADNRLVPVGTIGELYLGGSSLPKDYLNKAALTATRFVPNPFSETSGDRLYRTGNKVRYMSDGELAFVGRVKEQPRQRNFRIETAEIEARLLEHPMVKEVVTLLPEQVLPVPLLVAYVIREPVANDETPVNEEALRQYLKQQSPDILLPSVLMFLEQWPLTSDGEIDKSALPTIDSMFPQGEYIAPETKTEKLLTDIWAQLLKLKPEKISSTANFFEIGGHSLLSVRLLSAVNERLLIDLTIGDIFNNPVLADCSRRIDELIRNNDIFLKEAEKETDELSDEEVEAMLVKLSDEEYGD
ncbi:condensation domain-containing protein [Aliikangiella coralliicola]|uniref:AMP-binding protein n=1 Tax=Aliikangiella coralliicola TaxID=2592383 RepID=A0A545TV59_9GAMM|nr:condensation domain-containing protein [Aliikangiella coralliicola]TQV81102.1 AMP-binding protein [Aliikangiella coralliicola]